MISAFKSSLVEKPLWPIAINNVNDGEEFIETDISEGIKKEQIYF